MNQNQSNYSHQSVLLNESIAALNIVQNGIYVDATFGRGGHSRAILEKLNNTGKLICFDVDKDALDYYHKHFLQYKNCIFINSNFKNIKQLLLDLNIDKVDGIIFDLGVSSPMFDNASRGFSYKYDANLDMRMDQNLKISAYDIVNQYSISQLNRVFKEYGDIKNPMPISCAIAEYRNKKPINTTLELIEIIRKKTPIKMQFKNKHFARTYFQALRIEVNDEINNLKIALNDSVMLLNKNARIVTISFHSLEEKTIKNVYHNYLKNALPNEIPINNEKHFKLINLKFKKASNDELLKNNRSRSAVLKVIERVK
ncbi:MAG: 16S rRNA (cytosine(1402)-N(4))-methyltransferase RsmH [Malacoplasma sp.]|nr:16S rRNA (cytosine(1402)-N(4))-methyltransferase RsmH [Malacoplasma sp.]